MEIEILLFCAFSAVIVFITVFYMVKVLKITLSKEEISRRKFMILSSAFVTGGAFVVFSIYYLTQPVFRLL
ncbi:hypothetical protein [Alkalihalophilus marmarensis]|uniref:hypothetical protein n=1 Tax=Alkalihalophilus marmarensis TaxID=521377 RepID=UPI002DBF51AC|nr:hypothetical protein [Alkalihalophilus marmarensis]MEC2072723.1 hypothetical protein [Alkalihalophilus marmarensis]